MRTSQADGFSALGRGDCRVWKAQSPKFEQYQQHHVKEKDNPKSWDIQCYGIVKYLTLVLDMNPNMVDSIWTPRRAVLYSTEVFERLRSRRSEMLHKGCYHRFKGYAYSQLKKVRNKRPVGDRAELVEKFGYDTKYAMHLVRLLGECEQILNEHTLDLTRDRKRLRHIREGGWTLDQLEEWFEEMEIGLEKAYNNSTLPYTYDEDAMKQLLLECLEIHYGSIEGAVGSGESDSALIREIEGVLRRYK